MEIYEIIGVNRHASLEDACKAYRKCLRTFHPDYGGSGDNFDRLQKAWKAAENVGLEKVFGLPKEKVLRHKTLFTFKEVEV